MRLPAGRQVCQFRHRRKFQYVQFRAQRHSSQGLILCCFFLLYINESFRTIRAFLSGAYRKPSNSLFARIAPVSAGNFQSSLPNVTLDAMRSSVLSTIK